jgi:hypothetical protein
LWLLPRRLLTDALGCPSVIDSVVPGGLWTLEGDRIFSFIGYSWNEGTSGLAFLPAWILTARHFGHGQILYSWNEGTFWPCISYLDLDKPDISGMGRFFIHGMKAHFGLAFLTWILTSPMFLDMGRFFLHGMEALCLAFLAWI